MRSASPSKDNGHDEENPDEENPDEENPETRLSREGQQAFLRLIEKQKQQKADTDSDDSWGDTGAGSSADDLDEEEKEDDTPPRKPPRMVTKCFCCVRYSAINNSH